MGVVRILTDIQIPQSPLWCRETASLQTRSRNGRILGFPYAVRGKIRPFCDLVRILSRGRRYDVVLTANPRTAQLYGLFRKIFHAKSPKQIVLELMLDEEKERPLWRLKRMIQKVAFSSVDLIFVSSRKEVETYSQRLKISGTRLCFLPFHTNIVEPRMLEDCEDYILSAGRAGRDYATLAEALHHLDQRIIIVSDRPSVEGIAFPSNAEVLCDLPYQMYLDLLYRCKMVVVPLKHSVRSTGQVFLLEAMALGKPIIASEVAGTVDYVKSGVNGLLVPVADPKALRSALTTLVNDRALCKQLACNALETVKQNHTFDHYARHILNAALRLNGRAVVSIKRDTQ